MLKVKKWEPVADKGAPILSMPNVPLPLHSLAPRTIMGATEWNKTRTACYEACERKCEICGTYCDNGKLDGHELYAYDFEKCEAKLVRIVGLCKRCHGFIHSGRALTCFKNRIPLWTEEVLLNTAEYGFNLIDDWNKKHPDDKPLRVWATYLDWVKRPELKQEMNKLIEQYNIQFYHADNAQGQNGTWDKWHLLYNDTEYYSPFADRADWEKEMEARNRTGMKGEKDLFAKEDMNKLVSLDTNLFTEV